MRARLVLSPIVATLLLFSCRTDAAPDGGPRFERSRLSVVQRDGTVHGLDVELALDDAQRAHGLMWRTKLGENEGMLFVFDEDAPRSFWMRNTLIALDMIFVRSDGTIAGIVENAPPRTDTPRGIGAEPTRYVLEVRGGWCAQRGVKKGDRVELTEALRRAEDVRAR